MCALWSTNETNYLCVLLMIGGSSRVIYELKEALIDENRGVYGGYGGFSFELTHTTKTIFLYKGCTVSLIVIIKWRRSWNTDIEF